MTCLEDKFSKWPWNVVNVDDDANVIITVGMLRKLGSGIYNQLEKVRDAVIEAQISDISEALDDENILGAKLRHW